jgi:hypothetical protein
MVENVYKLEQIGIFHMNKKKRNKKTQTTCYSHILQVLAMYKAPISRSLVLSSIAV